MESSTGSIREPVFLCDLFPPEADPEFHGGEVPPREQIKEVRDGTIHILVTRGTEEACHQLFRLVEFFPQQPGLRWGYRRALQEKRQKAWEPVSPAMVLQLVQKANARIVDNEDDLIEVVLESLNHLQEKLTQNPLPQVETLWNYDGSGNRRHNFAPKDEEDLSDRIAAWLQDDLGGSHGIILNREVQPRRGQKTDILVDAVTNRDAGKDRLTIVIEVKGCWNPQVKTALKGQLVEDYLQKNGWSHGIYLVGWFMCSRWDHPTKRPTNSLDSESFEEAVHEVRELARPYDGKTIPFTVDGVVLDCRYPEHRR